MSAITINTKNQNSPFQNKPLSSSSQHDNKPSEDKGISNAAKMAIGATALATIIIAGFATKGKLWGKGINKVVETPNNESELNLLKEQAAKLKEKIKADYLSKRQNVLLSSEHTIDNCSMLDIAVLNQAGSQVVNKKALTLKDYDILINDYTKPGGEWFKRKNDDKQWISDFFSGVKDRLSELNKDSDWVEMRKMRKELIKNKKMRRSKGIKDIPKNEFARLELINEILYAKYTNQKPEILSCTGATVDDLIRIVKDKNTADKYHKLLEENSWPQFKTSLTPGTLRLAHFDSRALELQTKRDSLVFYDKRVNELRMAKEELKNMYKQLASETRSSDDVQKLKELNSKIKELSHVEG